jgi:hypothetical protein
LACHNEFDRQLTYINLHTDPNMHQTLNEHGKYSMQNNHLLSKPPLELKDNSVVASKLCYPQVISQPTASDVISPISYHHVRIHYIWQELLTQNIQSTAFPLLK